MRNVAYLAVEEKLSPPAKIDCLSLSVADIDEAIHFYQKNLGYIFVWRGGNSAGLKLTCKTAQVTEEAIALLGKTEISVKSVPDALEKCLSSGGALVVGPVRLKNIGLCALIEDPWKNIVTILDHSGRAKKNSNSKKKLRQHSIWLFSKK